MNRERITVTIKSDLLRQVDRLVDGLTIRSRSQAVEYLLSKFLSDFRLGSAFVLAGGRPQDIMIDGMPKFIANIKGKPLLERVLDSVHKFNVNNFIVYADTRADEIESALGKGGMPYNVEFLTGKKSSGTIAPLLLAKEKLKDTFLVAYGDTLASININEMLAFHRENRAIATIALTTVSNPKSYGVAMLQGNKITDFVQKPGHDVHSYLINAGYFLLEPEIFKYIGRGMKSIEKDLFPKLAERGLLCGYSFQGMYVNVNSKRDLALAQAFA